jgi:hypothetical protein
LQNLYLLIICSVLVQVIAALVTFGYIVSVALTRDPLGFLAPLHGVG